MNIFFTIINIMDSYYSDLYQLNEYYRGKLVSIITPPTSLGPLPPESIPDLFTGIFLEANESGIWIMPLKQVIKKIKINATKDFIMYPIIKIEEAGIIDPKDLNEKQKEVLKKHLKNLDNNKKSEKKEIQSKNSNIPDVLNPSDSQSINNALEFAKNKLIKEKNKKDPNDFLEKRNKI